MKSALSPSRGFQVASLHVKPLSEASVHARIGSSSNEPHCATPSKFQSRPPLVPNQREPIEPRRRVIRRADDRELVEEGVVERVRAGPGGLRVARHLVAGVDRARRRARGTALQRAVVRPGGEAREDGGAAARERPRAGCVLGDGAVHEGPGAQRVGVAARPARRRAEGLERACEHLRVRAEAEDDAVGDARRELEHARPRRRDLDGHAREPGRDPLDAARGAAALHRLAAEVRAQVEDIALERHDALGRPADLRERRVAAADAAEGAAAALDLERQRRGRGERGVARDGVRDARAEPDPRARARGEQELPPRFGPEVLRVAEGEVREARRLGATHRLARAAGEAQHQQPDVHARPTLSPERPRKHRPTSRRGERRRRRPTAPTALRLVAPRKTSAGAQRARRRTRLVGPIC